MLYIYVYIYMLIVVYTVFVCVVRGLSVWCVWCRWYVWGICVCVSMLIRVCVSVCLSVLSARVYMWCVVVCNTWCLVGGEWRTGFVACGA